MHKRAVICGISGQDGAYLAKHLLGLGYEIVGTSRDVGNTSFSGLKALGVHEHIRLMDMDTTKKDSVLRTVSKIAPDEIYNLSGLSSVAYSFQQPVEAIERIAVFTLYILDAIRNINPSIRLYNAGSSECFGEAINNPAH